MMSPGVFALYLLAFGAVTSLPMIFFRKDGKKNLAWWLTGAPFGLSTLSLVLAQLGVLSPLVPPGSPLGRALEVLSVPFAVGSIALIFATMATHRVPLALWHQSNDAPRSIVTYGPYSKVRHPFYVSFLLFLVGCVVVSPQIGTIAMLVAGFVSMSVTAAREERRLLASDLGHEYADYLKRTGRFVPRLVSSSSSTATG
jgi:protein-S-isoprenylcysteine O-methyltransferase Ste14